MQYQDQQPSHYLNQKRYPRQVLPAFFLYLQFFYLIFSFLFLSYFSLLSLVFKSVLCGMLKTIFCLLYGSHSENMCLEIFFCNRYQTLLRRTPSIFAELVIAHIPSFKNSSTRFLLLLCAFWRVQEFAPAIIFRLFGFTFKFGSIGPVFLRTIFLFKLIWGSHPIYYIKKPKGARSKRSKAA